MDKFASLVRFGVRIGCLPRRQRYETSLDAEFDIIQNSCSLMKMACRQIERRSCNLPKEEQDARHFRSLLWVPRIFSSTKFCVDQGPTGCSTPFLPRRDCESEAQ